MNRKRGRVDRVDADAGLEEINPQPQSDKIGTLSFPVCDGATIHNNTRRIRQVIRRRCPALLLCAGWSVRAVRDLESIITVTKQVKTIVVLEARSAGQNVNFRVCGGTKFSMGEQYFTSSKDASAGTVCKLNSALSARSFTFLDRQVLLLVCGEITIMCGQPPRVDFRAVVPNNLRDKVRAPSLMILNPTHTRMKRAREVNAWRKYLSSGGRTYVSASNWDLSAQKRPSRTLHTIWHNGQEENSVAQFENEFLCYREWQSPKP